MTIGIATALFLAIVVLVLRRQPVLVLLLESVTPVAMKFDGVTDSGVEHHAEFDYEHRFAEHEHDFGWLNDQFHALP
ncbi:hypothetical protein CA85_07610 [Allorhodopirellula solitaria]|uniref:Uncharacterized protein n=1 Tax=Allorhodopirellula solitaria TaxID=2527987 RepID=A0A5C5YFZ8_9BACT|nr:hypothetical protein CA85_07610 [Allorhodopirellula solitaria]